MINLSPSQLDGFAREVAGQVAEGFSFEQVARSLDLAIHELEQVFDSDEFKVYLLTYGEAVAEAFKETRAASRAGSFHRKISEKFDTYYGELDALAMNKSLKPEKRADILMPLMKYVAPADGDTTQTVRMPPALIENWVRRNHEYEAAAEEGRVPQDFSGIRNSEGREAEGEDKPVLLRVNRDADDGPDSGAAPSVRELHSDEPVERGSGRELAEVSVDASGTFQIVDRKRSVPTLVTDPRPEHVDSPDLVEGSKHKKVAGGNS